jgi:hypothetical protein
MSAMGCLSCLMPRPQTAVCRRFGSGARRWPWQDLRALWDPNSAGVLDLEFHANAVGIV